MIIGLCGAAGSGKDTVAGILKREAGFSDISFAEPIYRAVAAVTGMSVEQLSDRRIKEQPIEWLGRSPRVLLQTLGTEWGRDTIRDDIWVRIAMQRAAEVTHAAITDVRFANEAQAIRDAGGVVWRVVRPLAVLDEEAARHPSEAGIADGLVDAVIDNSGTLDDLEAAIRRLLAATMKE